jgi:asparagine synthase (glutamine-hydrolysing)
MDVNLSGWDGGTIMGHQDNIEPLPCDPFDDAAFLSHQFYLYNQKFTWPGLTEAEERLLYQDNFANNIIGLAFDSFKEAIHPYLGFRRDVRGEYFFLSQHCRYLTQNMVVFGRSHIEQRFPYFDYALFEFIYSLPATLRADRFLHRSVIQLETPKLSYIPYDHDNLPPTTHQLIRGSIQWKNRLQNAFNHHALPIFPEHPTLYADYENYLRHELRTWAENILYDRRTIERGFFKQSFLNTLIGRHISNREPNIIGKIAPIISYELMLRQLYD